MNERFMKMAIGGFVVGMGIFIWLGIKVLGHYEVVDPDASAIGRLPAKAESLLDVIKIKQDRHIRKSYSKENCYTWQDYDELKNSGKLDRLRENLKSNSHFLRIVVEIQKLSPEEWAALAEKAREVYSPTWEDRQKVGPPGQTQAGQDAERLIANTIVDLVEELRNS